tara:strand:- start:908 stop:1327 length:420 start_codon:yes stop_codon:yes gene_type:complete
MPLFIPVIVGTVARYAVGLTVTYVVGKKVVAIVDTGAGESIDDLENSIIDAGADAIQDGVGELADVLGSAVGALGSLSLDFLEGAIPAIINGIDQGYDVIRDKLRGKESDVIAGFTIGALSFLTVIYLYQSVKNMNNAL